MTSEMETFSDRLRQTWASTGQACWVPVLRLWIPRFDGWFFDTREEERDPAWAMTWDALRKAPLPASPAQAAFYLAQLPFNAWCAATLSITQRWNPLLQSYREFTATAEEAVCTSVAPTVPPKRITDTTQWLHMLYQAEVRRSASGPPPDEARR